MPRSQQAQAWAHYCPLVGPWREELGTPPSASWDPARGSHIGQRMWEGIDWAENVGRHRLTLEWGTGDPLSGDTQRGCPWGTRKAVNTQRVLGPPSLLPSHTAFILTFPCLWGFPWYPFLLTPCDSSLPLACCCSLSPICTACLSLSSQQTLAMPGGKCWLVAICAKSLWSSPAHLCSI